MKKLFIFCVLLGALYFLNTNSYAHDARVKAFNWYCYNRSEFWINSLHEAFIENNTDTVQTYYYNFRNCVDKVCSNVNDGHITLNPHTSYTLDGETQLYFVCGGYPGTVYDEFATTTITGETSATKTVQGWVKIRNQSKNNALYQKTNNSY